MGKASGCAADETGWLQLLAREPGAACALPLYAPLLQAADAPDGCFVLGRIAQTLDGQIATRSGASFWISGPEDILHTHRLRALFDAVVVGAGTIQADDPMLTTRHCPGSSPVRVVLDPTRRLGGGFRVFSGGPRTLLLVCDTHPGPDHVGDAEVVSVAVAADGTGMDLTSALRALAARGLCRVFIEGGGVTVSRFLAAGLLDRLHVTLAPLLLGAGIPAFTLPASAQPKDGMRLEWEVHRLGEDLLFDIPIRRARPPSCQGPIL